MGVGPACTWRPPRRDHGAGRHCFVLDASALLVLYRKEPGYERLLEVFAQRGDVLLLSAVAVAELGRRLLALGQAAEEVPASLERFVELFDAIVPVDAAVAKGSVGLAAELPFRIPLADSPLGGVDFRFFPVPGSTRNREPATVNSSTPAASSASAAAARSAG